MAHPTRAAFVRVLRQARRKREPVLAFNIVDLVSLLGVLEAAKLARRPVIAQASARTVQHYGATVLATAFQSARDRIGVTAFLHLDHCTSDVVLADAISAGFDGVMADGSHLPYEENIRWTKRWRVRTERAGVVLEAEVSPIKGEEDGHAGGSSQEPGISSGEYRAYCRAVRPDLVGADIGTRHGHYAVAPKLSYEFLRELTVASLPPFVVHGGSGLSRVALKRLSALGVAKLNISTDLKTAWRAAMESSSNSVEPLAVLQRAQQGVREMATEKLRILARAK